MTHHDDGTWTQPEPQPADVHPVALARHTPAWCPCLRDRPHDDLFGCYCTCADAPVAGVTCTHDAEAGVAVGINNPARLGHGRVVTCPACGHGIDAHHGEGTCLVGHRNDTSGCPCGMSPNGIAVAVAAGTTDPADAWVPVPVIPGHADPREWDEIVDMTRAMLAVRGEHVSADNPVMALAGAYADALRGHAPPIPSALAAAGYFAALDEGNHPAIWHHDPAHPDLPRYVLGRHTLGNVDNAVVMDLYARLPYRDAGHA